MRVISLRIKAITILSVLSLLLIAALSMLALLAQPELYRNLLLVTPAVFSAPGFHPEKVEQLCEDEFLVTYEIPQAKTAEAVHSTRPITAIGTNSSYRNILGYTVLDGSFFTKTAWDAKQKYAVLNETAAYDIFGSINISGETLKINGETWLVAGVMRDGDEESPNVYLPSSVTGGQADSLLAFLDANAGVNEAYAKNAMKELGVNEANYNIVNLSSSALAYEERFSVARETAVCILILIFIRYQGIKLKNKLLDYKNRLKSKYLKELFAENRIDLIKAAGSVFLLISGVAAILHILLQILEICLKWQTLPPASILLNEKSFQGRMAFLQDHYLLGTALFFISLVVLALILFLAWKHLPRETKDDIAARP